MCRLENVGNDSTIQKTDTVFAKLAKEEVVLAKFLFTNTINFESCTMDRGFFCPCVCFSFSDGKNSMCYVRMDFGISKHAIYNSKDELMSEFDLKPQELFRFVVQKYPHYSFLLNLNKKMNL